MKKTRRILALSGVILLIALYISTLVLACFQSELTKGLLMTSLAFTMILPIIIHFISVGIKNTEVTLGEDSSDENHSEEDSFEDEEGISKN